MVYTSWVCVQIPGVPQLRAAECGGDRVERSFAQEKAWIVSRFERAGRENERVSIKRRKQKTEKDEAREQSVAGVALLMTRRAQANSDGLGSTSGGVGGGSGSKDWIETDRSKLMARSAVEAASSDLSPKKRRGSCLD